MREPGDIVPSANQRSLKVRMENKIARTVRWVQKPQPAQQVLFLTVHAQQVSPEPAETIARHVDIKASSQLWATTCFARRVRSIRFPPG